MTQYFIQISGGQQGPLTLDELSTKNINANTPIWHEGLAEWTTAGKIEELKTLLSVSTPPPFQKTTTPTYEAPVAVEPEKKTFKLNMIQTFGVVIAVFTITYVYLSDGNTSSPSPIVASIDSSIMVEANNIESEKDRINKELTRKNRNYRNNWIDYIKASHGSYKTRAIGGIFDLEVVVSNNTEYILDEVKVNVNYIKENGGVYKSELITVYNVPANGKGAMPAPDSERGLSVEMEITEITSKKMHFCYSLERLVVGGNDPFFCKN